MASDLYKDILKDKDCLNKSNPRTRSFGGLTSSDYDYKNYLAGMRPRTRSNNYNSGTNDTKSKHPSFVESAARIQQTSAHNHSNNAMAMQSHSSVHGKATVSDSSLEKDKNTDTNVKHSSYSEISAVPLKKTFEAASNHQTHSDKEVDFNSLKQAQSDNTGSVGRLRSMFDKTSDMENKPFVQLRGNRSRKERPHSENFDQTEVKPKNKVSGIYDRHSVHVSPLQVEAIVRNEDTDENKEQIQNSQPKHKIDINSILAPEEPKNSSKNENGREEEVVVSPREEQKLLLSNLEIERIRRTQEEVQIEKKFQIKRRSLKERLNDLAADDSEKSESRKTDFKSKVAPPVAAKPDLKQDNHLKSKFGQSSKTPTQVNEFISEESKRKLLNDTSVECKLTVENDNLNNSTEKENLHSNDYVDETIVDIKETEDKHFKKTSEVESLLEKPVVEHVTEVMDVQDIESEQVPQSFEPSKVAVLTDLKLDISSQQKLEYESPGVLPVTIPRRDSDEFKSEIDKYKSAVERFDNFLNDHGGLSLDGQDPLKDFPNDFTPEDSSKLFSDDISVLDLNGTPESEMDNLKESDTIQSIESNSGSDDLMNSILKHMEQSNSNVDGQEYISLLHSSSKDEETEHPNALPPPPQNEKPINLISPEAPPRLSKLQGRTPQTPLSPQISVSEDLILPIEQPKVESACPEKPSSLSTSPPDPVIPVMLDNEDSDDSDQATTGYYSIESGYNTGQPDENLQNSDESGLYSPYVQNEYYETEQFTLPPPPAKSNISKAKQSKKKKVGFNDGNIQQVMFTYGPAEYDRANADIDPMASSAEWELEKRVENMDIFSVDLQKDERGLGLSIIGLGVGTDSGFEKLGIFVKTLTEKGAAQKDGRIQVNDQILEVNGVSLVGVTQFFAAQTLKGTSGVVRFLMGREKNKITQLSPGAPILDNPEMKKHIDEMNKTIAQLEEYENRAHEAERTLEDVKIELLKAEERAHEADQNLRETKEMLKAATESPFINGQRKLKNEIKKGIKRNNDKSDDLQRSLKDVTSRLSASEENLLELTSKYDSKHKELEEFQLRLKEKQEEECRLAEDNEQLNETLKQTMGEVEGLKDTNDKLKTLLQELSEKREQDIVAFQEKEREFESRLANEASKHKKYLEDIDKSHQILKQENEMLKQKVIESDLALKESANKPNLQDRLEQMETQLQNVQKSNKEKEDVIQTLNDKVEYLQELLTKVERSSTDRSTQIESQYITENTELKLKIKQLELELSEKPATIEPEIQPAVISQVESELSLETPNIHTPNLPKRENVKPTPNHIFGIKPPVIDRESKPFSPPTSPNGNETSFNLNVSLPEPIITTRTEDTTESILDVPDISSEVNEPNPIPKPPRGHFINHSDDQGVSVDKGVTNVVEKTTEIPVQPVLTSEAAATGEIKTNALVNVTIPPPPSVDFDELVEDKVDSDSIESEDQGQFQIIEGVVDEEKVSLDNYRGSGRRHTSPDTSKGLMKIESQEFFDSSLTSEKWIDNEWKRLDQEKQAELIAEQVVARSPVKRRISNASSSSEEGEGGSGVPRKIPQNQNEDVEIGRTQSIKIDSSYFQQSRNLEDSFDHEVSLLDDEGENQGAEKTPITKSLSFDSAIPATPVLDNRMAQDKLNVKSKRKPPTREGRKQMLESNEILDSEEKKLNSLPRNLQNNVAMNTSLAGAKSVPNLSINHDSPPEKSDKQKHKFEFHLPKLFKKSKIAKRSSHDKTDSISPVSMPKSNSVSTLDPPKSPQVEAIDIEEVFSAATPTQPSSQPLQGLQVELQSRLGERAVTPVDEDVVPIREKTESILHERANEAETEEAVVPFHQKEQSMLDETPDEVESINITSEESTPTHQTNQSTLASPDDVKVELSVPSSSSATSSLMLDTTESKIPSLAFEKQNNVKTYNERGIDVGTIKNGHTEEENSHWTKRPASSWDVRQVGLWLVEINLNQYVNSFKSHNVDGHALLRADGNKLKEYGVHNQEDRAEIKRRTKEIRNKLGKDSFNKGKTKDHKSTKGKLQFWKGKYRPY